MFGSVQKLIHRIRTLYGDSKGTYGGRYDRKKYKYPPQGTGQGNGAAPSIWSVLSSTVFEILHAEGYGTDFVFALSSGLFKLCGFSYVDDCDLLRIGDQVEIVHSEVQKMLTMWDELMEVNGGAIAPDKCWWYLADFVWKDGKWKMINSGESLTLKVRDKDRKLCDLQYLPISEAREMLGVYLAPDGNEVQEFNVLKAKIKKWTDFVLVGGLDWGTTWTALRTTIMKSLEYALPVTTFSEKQIKELLSPLYRVALPRSGYTFTYPRSVLHGPVSLQGNGLSYLYDVQYQRHIKDIIDYCHRDSTSGRIIRAAIEGLKLEAGIAGPLFEFKSSLPYLNTTNSWVLETWKYCREHNITFTEKCDNLSPKRKNDCLLMNKFLSQAVCPSDLKIINRCRLYLRVTCLSDITTGDGKRLQDDIFRGCKQFTVDSYQWPNQSRPPPRDWKVWRREVLRCFAPTHYNLTFPLGPWILSQQEYFAEWDWWLDNSKNLYRCVNGVWYSLPLIDSPQYRTRISVNSYSKDQSRFFRLLARPSHIQRTTVTSAIYSAYFTQGSTPWLPPQHCQPSSILTSARAHPDGWLFQFFDLKVSPATLKDLLINDKLASVSDGSFHPTRRTGSMGWCLACRSTGDIVLRGGGLIPGTKDLQCSYRSEAGGLLASTTVLQILENVLEITTPYNQIVACDGESALYRCLIAGREKLSTSVKHCDIISRCHDRMALLVGTIIPEHVRGHQESKGVNLTILEKINIKMDHLAKKIANICKRKRILSALCLPSTTDGMPTVFVDSVPIISELGRSLSHQVAGRRLKLWWMEKGRFNYADNSVIDWNVMKRCMTTAKSKYGRFISKWITNQIAVGTVMERRQVRIHNRCPRCDAHNEDKLHVLKCPHIDARALWVRQVKQLESWLEVELTHPDITSALCDLLLHWQSHVNSDHHIDYTWNASIKNTFRSQAHLGWHSMLEGLLSIHWAKLQQSHFESIQSFKSGEKWAGSLSFRLWGMIHAMWMHRNDALHDTDVVSDFCGNKELLTACKAEINIGLDDLDEIYAPYMTITFASLADESVDYRRNWFSIIRQAREDAGHIYNDIFTTNTATREWAGLDPPKILDESTQNDVILSVQIENTKKKKKSSNI